MGMGYTLYCKICMYEISADLGVGYWFPSEHRKLIGAARAGKLGETVRRFLEEHPEGVLNTEKVFLQCAGCGALKSGPDLSMYIRKPGVRHKTPGTGAAENLQDYTEYVFAEELGKGSKYQWFGYGNICGRCGKPMVPVPDRKLSTHGSGAWGREMKTGVFCPECREPLYIKDMSCWD